MSVIESKYKLVDTLIDFDIKKGTAFTLVGLTKQEIRTYNKQCEIVSAKKRDSDFAPCKPWRCPTCGHLLKIKTCFECKMLAQKARKNVQPIP